MKKSSLLIITGGLIIIILLGILIFGKKNTTKNNLPTKPTVNITEKIPSVTQESETDIIKKFINLINDQKPSEAVIMMTPSITKDDLTKQAWGVEFNAFKKMAMTKIEPSMQSDWTENQHSYKVTLIVEMKPEAASSAPIPNYGFDNGENIRWIQIEKIGDKWQVAGISTGP